MGEGNRIALANTRGQIGYKLNKMRRRNCLEYTGIRGFEVLGLF